MTILETGLSEVLRKAIWMLNEAGVKDAAVDGRILASAAFDLSREDMLRDPNAPLATERVAIFWGMIARRRAREPVSRILGKREFRSLEFEIAQTTLDPRSDSENLVEAALDVAKEMSNDLRILDIGTGTGCLLLSILRELPDARGVGTDIDPGAVACARRNASALGLSNRSEFLHTSWVTRVKPVFDIVVSNPPYIPSNDILGLAPEVSKYDPLVALDGGVDGLEAYRSLAECIGQIISRAGAAVLEVGDRQASPVAQIFALAGYYLGGSRQDLAGNERVLILLPNR
ncbi:MAG: Release factor glutamine methyltransferase [Alphaproteobacteria bacterium MarineAlpha11_Bin1]|nr:MAG: Release factor glutamine methyltransferase [Alphaproteobacteria bacterium MarineAlpha11_Bin1]